MTTHVTNLKRILQVAAGVLLALLACATITWADDAPFTIEGLALGMPAETLKAHGLKLKWGTTWVAPFRHDPSISAIPGADGTVRMILAAYSTPWYGGGPFGTTIGKDGLTPDALIKIVTERYGPPQFSADANQPLHNIFNAEIAHEHTFSAVWVRGDQILVVRYEREVSHIPTIGVVGPRTEPPSLELRIGRGFTLEQMVLPSRALQRILFPADPVTPEAREKVKF